PVARFANSRSRDSSRRKYYAPPRTVIPSGERRTPNLVEGPCVCCELPCLISQHEIQPTSSVRSRSRPLPWWRKRRHGRSRRGPIGRSRIVAVLLFPRTAQSGGGRGPGSLLLLCAFSGPLDVHFFLGPYNFLPVHFHDFQANHLVTHKPYELHVLRRLAIDALFELGFVLVLTDFLGGR